MIKYISFLRKNRKIILTLITIYLFLILIKNIINFYTFIFIIIGTFYFYNKDKKVFKKTLKKLIYRNKSFIQIKNKFEAAQLSLKGISSIQKSLNNKITSELITNENKKLEIQLRKGNYNVILFGAGSCGKTSIARALLNRMVGEISPNYGTTKKLTSYKINIPFLKRKVNIIDTPGLFEASELGKNNEKLTLNKASKSDLIIFVIDQDINKYELYLIKELSKIGKSIILVLNKCDIRSQRENKLIIENLKLLISRFNENIKIVETIASPQSISINSYEKSIIRSNVNNLFKLIIEILENEGEELLADNILFQCNKLGLLSKKILNEQRIKIAKRTINKYSWITSGVIMITPIPAIDLLATTAINIQMIIDISKIYDVKITKKEAKDLAKSIISAIASLGIVKGGMNVITSTLSINFSTIFISKSLQAFTSAWLIRIVGLSLMKYFKQNQSWGDGGIQEVVQDMYEINKREDVIKKFLNEAINKIINEKNQTKLKLPPFLQNS